MFINESKVSFPSYNYTVLFKYVPITFRILTGIKPNQTQISASVTIADAVDRVKKLTGLQHVRLALGNGRSMDSKVDSVALCAGSGASVLKGVKADLYLTGKKVLFIEQGFVITQIKSTLLRSMLFTGEMLHHDILDAAQKGITVILTNHSDSERGFLKIFKSELQKRLEYQVDVIVSNQDRDPLVTV